MTSHDETRARAPWRVNRMSIAVFGLLWVGAWGLVLVQAFAPLG